MINFSFTSRSDMGYTKVSAGIIAAPTITDNNGILTLGEGIYMLFSGVNYDLPLIPYKIQASSYTFTDKTTNYIVASYSGGNCTLQVITDKTLINQSNIIEVLNVYREGTRLEYNNFVSDPSNGLANRISDMLGRVYGYIVEPDGLVLGETGTRSVTVSDGYVWDGGSSKRYLDTFNSFTDSLVLYYHSSSQWSSMQASGYINNQYDDGVNLQSTSLLKYATNWVFRHVASKKCFIVLGGNYFLGGAQASKIPANLPPEITTQSILIGRIIVGRNDNTATEITSAFETKFEASPITDHESLANLYGGDSGDHWHLTEQEHIIATRYATREQDGILDLEDYIKFDNKQNQISTGTSSQYLKGDLSLGQFSSDVLSAVGNFYLKTDQTSSQQTSGVFRFQDISLESPGTVTRDANGYIHTIVKSTRILTFTRDINGFVTSVTDGVKTWTISRDTNNYITGWIVT